MRLWQEIREQLNDGPPDGVVTGALYTVWEGKGGYFQNVKRLVQFSSTEVVLRGRTGAVRVEGENLSLGKYFAGDLVIEGDIARVERVT